MGATAPVTRAKEYKDAIFQSELAKAYLEAERTSHSRQNAVQQESLLWKVGQDKGLWLLSTMVGANTSQLPNMSWLYYTAVSDGLAQHHASLGHEIEKIVLPYTAEIQEEHAQYTGMGDAVIGFFKGLGRDVFDDLRQISRSVSGIPLAPVPIIDTPGGLNTESELFSIHGGELYGAAAANYLLLGASLFSGGAGALKATSRIGRFFRLGAKAPNLAAHNVSDALRLRTTLALQEAGILDSAGELTAEAISGSRQAIRPGTTFTNKSVVDALTKDGSQITDWTKLKTQSVDLSSGQRIQVHFYRNQLTGEINYTHQDFKVKGIVNEFYTPQPLGLNSQYVPKLPQDILDSFRP